MILEDKNFVASYIGKSRKQLAEGYLFVTKILEEAGSEYIRNG